MVSSQSLNILRRTFFSVIYSPEISSSRELQTVQVIKWKFNSRVELECYDILDTSCDALTMLAWSMNWSVAERSLVVLHVVITVRPGFVEFYSHEPRKQ